MTKMDAKEGFNGLEVMGQMGMERESGLVIGLGK